MATYKEIKGVTIQTLDSDPVEDKGTFSAGGDLNSGRSLAAAGDKTAGLGFGGYDGPPNARIDLTEKYDGTSWSEVNELNAGRYSMVGFGSQTAAIGAGGYASPPTPTPHRTQDVESWNGTNWTEVAELNSDMRTGTGFGTATAGYVIGGVRGGSVSDAVESWNGSSWTETTEINTGRVGAAGAGITTAGLIFGGSTPTITGITESWNGSAWTEVADMPTAADSAFGGGTSTLAAAAGGSVPSKITTLQLWDGSNWTTNPTGLAGQRSSGGTNSSPTQGNLLVTGGTGPGPTNYNPTATEELSFPPPTAAILTEGDLFLSGGTTLKGFGKNAGIPAATWSSGGSMNTGRSNHFALGGLNDNLVTSPQGVVTTEQYNGTSWTALSSPANSGEGRAEGGSAGTSAAGVIFGGWEPGASALVESWNGSAWTEVNELNTGRNELAGFGTSTAAFGAGGKAPGNTLVESWDGTSWTETTEINTGRGNMGGSGTTTDGLIFGGNNPNNANAEKWDGSAWTEVGDLNTARRYGAAGGGVGPISIYAGGYTGSSSAVVESWNGSSWTEINDLSSADYSTKGAPAGTNISTIVTGGGESNTTTEEFTADLALAAVTVS